MNKNKPPAGRPSKSNFKTGPKSRGPAKDSYSAKPRGPRTGAPPRAEGKFSPKPSFARGPREDRPSSDRPPRKFGDKPAFKSGPRDSGGEKRSFSPKPAYARGAREDRPPSKYGDKPAYNRGPRADGPTGDRPPRKFGDKPAFKSGPRDSGGDKRSFSAKPPYARGPREDRPPSKYGDKPAFKSGPRSGDREERSSFAPKPPYARGPREDRPPSKYGDKPAFKSGPRSADREERSSFAPKPPYARGPREERPPGKYGDKPAFKSGPRSGDRKERSSFAPKPPSARGPRKDGPSGDRPEGDRPPRKFAAKRADNSAGRSFSPRPPSARGPREDRPGSDRPPRKFGDKPAFKRGPRDGDREERSFSPKPSYKRGPQIDGPKRASRDSFAAGKGKPAPYEGEIQPRVLRPKIASKARVPGQTRPKFEDHEHDPQKTLERVLSKAGLGSRTDARSWIGQGRVKVNGKIIQTPDHWIDIGHDKVTMDGKPVDVDGKEVRYVLLYKPKGYLTTVKDPEGRPTVYDLLKDIKQFIVPVGRLDLDSTGLLMLTNDTKFADFVTSPESHLPKTYMVKVSKKLTDEQVDQLRNGIELLDGMTRPAEVTRVRDTEKYSFLDITITEGRNRQVRRMIEALDAKVLKLVRTSIGPITIGDLEIGTWRELSEFELRALRNRTDI